MEVQNKKKSLKIVIISDTHNKHPVIQQSGDIFIHCGDFSLTGKQSELKNFYKYLDGLNFKYKIVIAGNHDLSLDQKSYPQLEKAFYYHYNKNRLVPHQVKQQIKNHCIYLEHEFIQIQGIKIFGSPYTPQFFNWAFMYNSQEAKNIWNLSAQKIDILITHGPPYGILDECPKHVGCPQLLKLVEKMKPRYHFFGHIHETYGYKKQGQTQFYNCSILDQRYFPVNQPVIIEYKK